MSRRLLTLGAVLLASLASAAEVEVIQNNGPSSQRIDLILLGDGYTSGDQAKLSEDALGVVEGLFQETPYAEYRALFNIKVIHVISNQTGADNGTYGVSRDTALGTFFNCSGIDRLLCANNGVVSNIAAQDTPEYDVLVVIANDPKYGGSGGSIGVVSTHPAAIDLLRHELSHTIAGLADEYEDAYPSYPACSTSQDCPEPNATLRNTRTTAKWAAWIESSTPVPTPETGANPLLGVYEGARYKTSGVYRPKDALCLMKEFTTGSHFCSVCREGLIWSFWRRAPVINSLEPANTGTVQVCQGATLKVNTPPTTGGSYSYLWTVDGVPSAQSGATFVVDSSVSTGNHNVTVVAKDASALVRNDPSGLLSEQAQWTVQACTAGICDEVAACSGSTCETTPKAAGTACGEPTCSNGAQTAASTCNGSGTCVALPSVPCGAYTCDDAAVACRSTCTSDDHCSTGRICSSGACVAPPNNNGGNGGNNPFSCLGCSTSGAFSWAAVALVGLARGLRRRRR